MEEVKMMMNKDACEIEVEALKTINDEKIVDLEINSLVFKENGEISTTSADFKIVGRLRLKGRVTLKQIFADYILYYKGRLEGCTIKGDHFNHQKENQGKFEIALKGLRVFKAGDNRLCVKFDKENHVVCGLAITNYGIATMVPISTSELMLFFVNGKTGHIVAEHIGQDYICGTLQNPGEKLMSLSFMPQRGEYDDECD